MQILIKCAAETWTFGRQGAFMAGNCFWQPFLTDSVTNFSILLGIFELWLFLWLCQTIQINDPIDHWSLVGNFNELYVPFIVWGKMRIAFSGN